jgi:hypothetical protein
VRFSVFGDQPSRAEPVYQIFGEEKLGSACALLQSTLRRRRYARARIREMVRWRVIYPRTTQKHVTNNSSVTQTAIRDFVGILVGIDGLVDIEYHMKSVT